MDKLDLEPIDDQKPLDLEPLDLEPIQEESSTLSDLGTGAAQGATFGFADELISALKTPELSKLFWSLPKDDVAKQAQEAGEKYRAQQKIEQQKVAEARERSPIAFTTGEIGAGILPALFTGGTTAAATGAKAAPGFLRSLFGAAGAGAGYGALSAAGTTETPIEDTGEFVGEVAKGGLAGATIGGALGAAGYGIKTVGRTLEDADMARQSKVAYERAKKGLDFTGEKATERQVGIREPRAALSLENQILNTRSVLGQKIDDVLEVATAQGKVIGGDTPSVNAALDIQEVLRSKPGIFGRDLLEDISSKADKLAEGTLSPKEANELRRTIRDKFAKIREKGDVETSEILERAKDALQGKLNEIEGFAQANKDYTTFLRSTAETIFKKGMPEEAIETSLSEIAKPKEKLFGDLMGLIRKAEAPGSSSDEKRRTLVALRENLADIERERPGFLKSVGFDAEKFIGKIKEEADISAISQTMRGYEPQSGFVRQALGAITPRAITYKVAETAGKTAGAIGRSMPAKLASKVYSAAEPELRSLSEKLMSSPATRRFGESLAGSLDKPGGVARRAVLFSIMQSPEARKAVSELYPGVGEE
jgi:hypothetical protein